MSTTINVTVDDGGLPARNRQQTAANRQAFVQGQASQQAAQQGVDQRAADRRAAGLDPATGRPLASAGASSRLPRIDQEPAASRRGGDVKLIITPATQILGVNSETFEYYEVAQIAGDINNRVWKIPPNGSQTPRYLLGLGSPRPYFYAFGENFYTSSFGEDVSTYKVTNVAQSGAIASLRGVPHANVYEDGVGLFCRHPQMQFTTAESVKFTMEMWIKPSLSIYRTFSMWLIKDAQFNSEITAVMDTAGFRSGGPNTLLSILAFDDGFTETKRISFVRANELASDLDPFTYSRELTYPVSPFANTWTHIALVADSEDFRFYIDGIQLFSAVRTDIIGSPIGQCVAGLDFYSTVVGESQPFETSSVYMSQYRFSRNVKYTSNFVPPQRF